MSRLVTGLFYVRSEAERAVEALRAAGIPADSIYLETEVTPSPEVGRKGGSISSLEKERRFAGEETGLITGVTVGILAGAGTGILGGAIAELMRSVDRTLTMPAFLGDPVMSTLIGAVIGLIAGGLIGWVVDYTLSRLGAGPPLPAQETLVTVRTDDTQLDQVYAALHRARARHLHVSESAAI